MESETVEAYYSSDEDFAWGPVTAREIQNSLKLKQKKINRRHSACVLLSEQQSNTEDMSKTSEHEYTTATENLTTENSSDFLSKINDVVSTGSTCYVSANDETNNLVNSMCLWSNDSFATAAKHSELSNLSHLHETDMSHREKTDQLTYKSCQKDNSDDCLLKIDLSQFDDSISESDCEEKQSLIIDLSQLNINDEDTEEDNGDCHSTNRRFADVSSNKAHDFSNKNSNDSLDSHSDEYLTYATENNSKSYENEEYSSLSGINLITNSSYNSKLEETSADDSYNNKFNDTLEDMERLLQQEENYYKNSKVVDDTAEFPVAPVNIISGSFLSSSENSIDTLESKPYKSHKKINVKSEIPVCKILVAKSNAQKNNGDNFKIPKPLKTKTPSKSLAVYSNYKNVISPVSVYIHNTPTACLKQNVTPKVTNLMYTPTKLFDKPSIKNTKSPALNIPEVIYKPAKEFIKSHEEKVHLPESIRKHVIENKITVHENRIKSTELSETFISNQLAECDLTSASLDLTSRASGMYNHDISVITEKQVIIEKKRGS